ncbi:MAG: UTP--glucose-1-phosphate uridylyltransferase GalU [Deltaproteobacteria bacterium]|nr:UTP--glucose-1-phosphate uridylyltransferase GalU [Deltaproteobacteria bacterium]
MQIRKAVIPAAGLGTRFLPATKAIPKEMIPIIDKPMIQYIVEECVDAGIRDIILVSAEGKESIENHFGRSAGLEEFLRSKGKFDLLKIVERVSSMANIITVHQKSPMGLGHAVLTARAAVGNEPFAVLLGDDLIDAPVPCIRQLTQVFERHGTSVIGVMEVPREDVSKYGIVSGKKISDRLINVDLMVEKPDPASSPSRYACPGRYVLTPKIFDLLEKTKPGKSGEIQLTDALALLAAGEGLLAYLFEGTRYDTGDKLGYLEATAAFALKRPDLAPEARRILARLLES